MSTVCTMNIATHARDMLCARCFQKGGIYQHAFTRKRFPFLRNIDRLVSPSTRDYFMTSNSYILSSRPTQKIVNRRYGVRTGQSFTTAQATEQFVQWLMPEERKALFQALIKYQSAQDIDNQVSSGDGSPTLYQLQLVIFSNAVPFIGFGFLDNAIMILAGDYIDKTIGITLGISTMAAAALGNLISDLFGIGLAGYVETLASKLGFDMPPLTPKQASMWQTIYCSYIGRAFGIVIGCLVGMFPLIFLDEEDEANSEN